MQGWCKRVNRSFKSVTRAAQLNDEFEIDPSRDTVSCMRAAAHATSIERKVAWLFEI